MKATSRPWAARQLRLILFVVLLSAACRGEPRIDSPPRPSGVPPRAHWLGRPDGGAWVALLSKPADSGRRAMARIYRQDGSVWYAGTLTLSPDSGPPVDLRDPETVAGWDGEALLLRDGRVLRPRQQ